MDRWLLSRQGRRIRSCVNVLAFTFFLVAPVLSLGMPAYPGPVFQEQGDGSTVELRVRGDEHFNWLEDANGFTVVREGKWLYYAQLGSDGRLEASGFLVGRDDPAAAGLNKGILPSGTIFAQSALSVSPLEVREQVPPLGTVKNLVILVRFSDHAGRTLPTEQNIDVLMNQVGGDPVLAPTGSVRDVYLENSYGAMTLVSTVTFWKTVSNTEAYYANGVSGDDTLWEALIEALDTADFFIDFTDYDTDGDGYIDSITFLHSGYGAEWDGNPNHIWSHRWAIQNPPGGWVSDEGVRVFDYHISPSLWGTSGSEIGRIGVIAHETGHFFGLPDLYDTNGGGEGIGSWGLMANSWDFDFTQRCPPHFSPWSKVNLGWYSPTVISGPGQFTLNEAEHNPEVYRIDQGYPAGEYLMIENRQNTGFDCTIPQGGLLIWHIDDAAGFNTEGYPGQPGWPGNGNHYRVALLQADGAYNLEKDDTSGRGDAGDPHHAAGVDAMAPGPGGHPNTDTYQSGIVTQTGHVISDISAAGPSMTFCLNGCSGLNAPSNLTATANGTTAIDLGWTDNSPDEDGFRIERSPDGSSWSPLTDTVADVTAFGDTGLNPGSTYYYRVRAFTTVPELSGWSNTASATTDQVPPAAPSALSATAAGTDQIDLVWTDNSGNEVGFTIERSLDGASFSHVINVANDVTSYSDSGLLASTTYHYRVFAFNTAGNSGNSNVASDTTDDLPPFVDYVAYADQFGSGDVSGSYVSTQTDNGAAQSITEKVSGGKKRDRTSYMGHFWRFNIGSGDIISLHANAWQSASGDGDNFVFAWSENDVTYNDLFTVSSTSTGNTETDTIPNTVSGEVWIRVIDTNRTGGNDSSLDTVFVDHLYIRVENAGPPTPPLAPSGLSAAATGPGSIFLQWIDESGNETAFIVERSPDGTTGWAEVVNDLPAGTTSYSDTGLASSTTYFYRVLASNAAGSSGPSNVASATTDAPPTPPAAPSGLSAFAPDSSSMDLAWTDNSDNETGFQIQRSLDESAWSMVASIGADATNWSDSGLAGGTTYFYQVRAINGPESSAWSNTASDTTDPAPDISLTTVGYKTKGRKHFDLTWSGAMAVNVDVYRDGVKIATTLNDGSYLDATTLKGGGSHTHKVCDENTQECSNITTTSF